MQHVHPGKPRADHHRIQLAPHHRAIFPNFPFRSTMVAPLVRARKAQLGGSKDFSNSNVWLILTELGN
jgi:hypothetical protein